MGCLSLSALWAWPPPITPQGKNKCGSSPSLSFSFGKRVGKLKCNEQYRGVLLHEMFLVCLVLYGSLCRCGKFWNDTSYG